MEYKLTIAGPATPKGRPRMGKYGAYTPKKTVNFEGYVRFCWQAEFPYKPPSEKPITVMITFYMPIPKSVSKRKKQAMIDGDVAYTKKPDLDNLGKSIMDALNGVAYKDDAQINAITLYKTYSDEPRTEIVLIETENDENGQK